MDRSKIDGFMERFLELASGATTMALLAVADRTGLLRWLAEAGSVTAEEAAGGAGLDRRYVEEVVAGLAAAGVLEYDDGRYTLPPEHAVFVADETSPFFMGGWMDILPMLMTHVDGVAAATRHGGGIPFSAFGDGIVQAIERGNAPSFNALLVRRWLPAVPGLVGRLEEGMRVAEVGCGTGTAATLVAQAFPNSTVHGFDVSEESIEQARRRGDGVSNLEFHLRSVDDIPDDPSFDLVTTFDVVHDLVDPLAGLRRIRQALAPDGIHLMMEPHASSDVGGNLHPRGALLYGVSTLHCMTQSLALGGAGLGAAWGTRRAEELANEAGFSSFEILDSISNPFSAFYLLRP